MHAAKRRAAARSLADICSGTPPFGSSFWHACWADWNTGDCGSSPDRGVSVISPRRVGSGKFVTPCARMHRANVSPGLSVEAAGLADDPHALSASAQPAIAKAA
jgi:hypothetical protein